MLFWFLGIFGAGKGRFGVSFGALAAFGFGPPLVGRAAIRGCVAAALAAAQTRVGRRRRRLSGHSEAARRASRESRHSRASLNGPPLAVGRWLFAREPAGDDSGAARWLGGRATYSDFCDSNPVARITTRRCGATPAGAAEWAQTAQRCKRRPLSLRRRRRRRRAPQSQRARALGGCSISASRV